MRWMYGAPDAGAEPELRLRPRGRGQAAPADALEHVSFFVIYANIDGFTPYEVGRRAVRRPGRSTAGSSRARSALVGECREALDTCGLAATSCARSRRSSTTSPTGTCAAPGRASGPDDASAALRDALVRARAGAALRRAGDAVPDRRAVAEPRPRGLRGRAGAVHLAGYPEVALPDPELLGRGSDVRRVVELGRRAATPAQAAPAAAPARRRRRAARAARTPSRSRTSSASRRSR